MNLIDSFNALTSTGQTAVILMMLFLIAYLLMAAGSILMLIRTR